MTIKVLRDNCIFILAVAIFLSSCQLTTTGEKKSVLDEGLSTEEQAQSLEKDVTEEESNEEFVEQSDQDFVVSEKEPTVEKQYPIKETYENISSAQKIKDEKRILDFFSDFFKSDEEELKKSEIENKKKVILLKNKWSLLTIKKSIRICEKNRLKFLNQKNLKMKKEF